MDRDRFPDLTATEERARPALRPAAPAGGSLASFASAIGNRAMGAFVARLPMDGIDRPPPGTSPADRGFDLRSATDEQKLAEIEVRLSQGHYPVADIWKTFADLPATANANAELWKRSLAKNPWLARDEAVLAEFKHRVEGVAIGHLEQNRKLVVTEIEALGITPNVGGSGGTVDERPEHTKQVEQLQRLAAEVGRAMRAKEILLRVPVGWSSDRPELDFDGGTIPPVPMVFNPAGPPPHPSGPEDKGHRSWAAVHDQYKTVEATLAQGMAHPALFAIMSYDGGVLGSLAGLDNSRLLDGLAKTDRRGASVAITNHMRRLIESIEAAARGIGGDIDYRDLKPVHDQVMQTPPFTQPFEQSVAQQEVKGHEQMKTLTALGLSAVQVVALIGAYLSGGALLPLVGVAAGGLQAGISIDEYQKLKTARDARTGNKEHDLVGQEQVDEAQVAAVLDTVFAFLDGIETVSALSKAARGGAQSAEQLLPQLGKLGTLDAREQEKVLLAAMESIGAGKAIEAAGGIEAVRGAGAAGARAEAFATEIEARLAEHLAGPAGKHEDLVAEAERFAASASGVSHGKALDTLAPELKQPDKLQELVAALRGKPYTAWNGLSPEARMALAHDAAAARFARVGMPAPKGELTEQGAKNALFDHETWTIRYSRTDFAGDVTYGDVIDITGLADHEFRHAEQDFMTLRYLLATGEANPGTLTRVTDNWDVINAARAQHASKPMDLAGEEAAKAKAWHAELVTTEGRAQRKQVMDAIYPIINARKAAEDALGAATSKAKLAAQLQSEGRAAAEIEAATADAVAAHNNWVRLNGEAWGDATKAPEAAYRSLVTEADAYKFQDESMAVELDRLMSEAYGADYRKRAAEQGRRMSDLVKLGLVIGAAETAAGITYAMVGKNGAAPEPQRAPAPQPATAGAP